MNYGKIYIALIERGQQRAYKKGIGLHKHRILPHYQGGKYIEGNIAYLTREEHRLVHKLRYRLFGDIREMGARKLLGGKLTQEQAHEWSKKGGKAAAELNAVAKKFGWYSLSKDQRHEYGQLGAKALSTEQRRKNGKVWGAKSGRKGGKASVASQRAAGSGPFDFSTEQRREYGRRGGISGGGKGGIAAAISQKVNGTGFWGITKEERQFNSRKGGLRTAENKTGLFSLSENQRHENNKKGGAANVEKHKEGCTGFFNLSAEQRTKAGKAGGAVNVKNKTGLFGRSEEQRIEHCRLGGKKGGLKHKGKVRVRCKISGKCFEPSAAKAWLMVLTGDYAYVRKDLQLACQLGLLANQLLFLGKAHD